MVLESHDLGDGCRQDARVYYRLAVQRGDVAIFVHQSGLRTLISQLCALFALKALQPSFGTVAVVFIICLENTSRQNQHEL